MNHQKIDSDLIRKGVDDAFANWLIEHEISFPALLEQTIGEVFTMARRAFNRDHRSNREMPYQQ
jgi:hypothetical protein